MTIKMCHGFKESIQREFDMVDLGRMIYFLVIQVTQCYNMFF